MGGAIAACPVQMCELGTIKATNFMKQQLLFLFMIINICCSRPLIIIATEFCVFLVCDLPCYEAWSSVYITDNRAKQEPLVCRIKKLGLGLT